MAPRPRALLVPLLLLVAALAAAQDDQPACECAEGGVNICLPKGGALLKRFAGPLCEVPAGDKEQLQPSCPEDQARVCLRRQPPSQ